jgi:all-trans-retinol dehydrogenase (NAD+)
MQLVLEILYAIFLLFWTPLTATIRLLIPFKYRSKSVKNELVLITGAGSGIGRLLAKKFASLGAQLVLLDVNQTANEQTAEEIRKSGGKASAYKVDLCNRLDIYRVADEVFFLIKSLIFLYIENSKLTFKHFFLR